MIETQEELNKLAEVTGIATDSLHIDEEYVAYMDEVLMVVPRTEIDETHFMRDVEPTIFRKWYKKVKDK